MSSDDTTQCPDCGEQSQDSQWCDNCGAPLEADGSDESPVNNSQEEDVWLAAGNTLEVSCELDTLSRNRWQGRALLQFDVIQVVEASSVRHISTASCVKIIESDLEAEEHAKVLEFLQAQTFSIEELSALLWSPEDKLPEPLRQLVRLPLGEVTRGDHQVRVFLDDSSMALEEFIMDRKNFLETSEVRQVFGRLLELVEDLHSHGYLYLRLSPWTLRLKMGLPPKLDPPAPGLGHEETHPEAIHSFESESEASEASNDEIEASQEEQSEPQDQHEEDLDASTPMTQQGSPAQEEPDDALQESTYVERALLDGGFRFYEPDTEYEEVPVVVGFSPPEMFGRLRADITVACDVFSLGMLLYFLISGELPPTSVYTRYVPALPARHFRPDFPLGFQGVIARATRPNPAERFESVAAMREAFERAGAVCDDRFEQMQSSYVPRIDFSVERHIGISKRLRNPTNQDQVFGATSEDQQFALIVVADGVSMANYGSGDIASKHVADVAAKKWPALLEHYSLGERIDEFEVIYSILGEANLGIIDDINTNHYPFEGSPHEVMGTTTLVAVIQNGIVTLGSLGDSRAYLQRGSTFEQITIDHNLWTLSILDGVPADSAMALPHGDALARCLGTFFIEENRLMPIPPQPDIFRFPVIPGDTLLMTTDGLIDFAGPNPLSSEDNVLSVLLSESNTALACLELILLANRGGGGDNIGVGLMRFH